MLNLTHRKDRLMIKISTVFLDVDGVLADFRKGVHEAFSKPYNYPTLTKKWLFWDDWPDVTSKMVNAICTIPFWANLEWMHDGYDILTAVEYKFAPAQICLLTTPMPNVESATGRWMWIKKHMPIYYSRTIITQAPKHLLARPDTLLIDDKDENVDGFREAGGNAIRVPRPWNSSNFWSDVTLGFVKSVLGNF